MTQNIFESDAGIEIPSGVYSLLWVLIHCGYPKESITLLVDGARRLQDWEARDWLRANRWRYLIGTQQGFRRVD